MEKNCVFKAISSKIFHPLNAVNNGGTQNGSVYRKGLWAIQQYRNNVRDVFWLKDDRIVNLQVCKNVAGVHHYWTQQTVREIFDMRTVLWFYLTVKRLCFCHTV